MIKPIIWMFHSPAKFPCMVCESMRAEFRRTIKTECAELNICVCPTCAALTDSECLVRLGM